MAGVIAVWATVIFLITAVLILPIMFLICGAIGFYCGASYLWTNYKQNIVEAFNDSTETDTDSTANPIRQQQPNAQPRANQAGSGLH